MMNVSKSNLSILAVAVLVSIGAQAQNIPDPLVQAVRKAVASNPEVQARWSGFKAAGSERDVARGSYLPQIDLSAAVGNETRSVPGTNYGNYSSNTTQITLSQMLFDGMYTASEVKRLGYAKLTRYYELAEASETAAYEAVRAYADVVRYRELVDVATQNYVEHKTTALQVEERANSGMGRRVDVEQANGRLALAESNLLTELTNLHDVSARYLRVVGEKPGRNLVALPEAFKLGALPESTEVLMRDGLQGSPSLHAALENARAAKSGIASKQSAYLPRLDVKVYQNWDSNASGVRGDSNLQGAQLVLNYNLFRGGADRARVRQAVELNEQALDLKDKVCRDVRQALSIAYSEVRSLGEQLRYQDRHRLATEKSREAYRQQFNAGQRTLLDLLDTQNEYFEATRSYINTRHNQIAAQARTLSGMGKLVTLMGVHRVDMPSAADAGQDQDSVDPVELCPLEESIVDTLDKIKADNVVAPRAPVAAAAAKPCDLITLLPDASGKVGTVVYTSDKGGEVRLDKAYSAAVNDCANVKVQQSSAKEVDERYTVQKVFIPLAAKYYRLYFELGKTTLLPESQATLQAVLEDYRTRPAPEVTIIGHADKSGNSQRNEELSRQRAASVREALVGTGSVPAENLEAAWRGDRDPLPGTEGKVVEKRNRRVEIKVQ